MCLKNCCIHLWFCEEEVPVRSHSVTASLTISRNNCNSHDCAIVSAFPQVHIDQLQETIVIPEASKLTGNFSVKLTSL